MQLLIDDSTLDCQYFHAGIYILNNKYQGKNTCRFCTSNLWFDLYPWLNVKIEDYIINFNVALNIDLTVSIPIPKSSDNSSSVSFEYNHVNVNIHLAGASRVFSLYVTWLTCLTSICLIKMELILFNILPYYWGSRYSLTIVLRDCMNLYVVFSRCGLFHSHLT